MTQDLKSSLASVLKDIAGNYFPMNNFSSFLNQGKKFVAIKSLAFIVTILVCLAVEGVFKSLMVFIVIGILLFFF